ncbi:ATP-binding protein [Pseudoroseomonas wenyumeiae]
MLTHPTSDRLRELGLAGMARALEEQRRHPDAAELGFEDRLAMLVDREALERDGKRLAARLRFAGLRQQATPEDVDLDLPWESGERLLNYATASKAQGL